MNSDSTTTREPLDNDISQSEIDRLIQERKDAGATDCQVEQEGDGKVLVCQWPPL